MDHQLLKYFMYILIAFVGTGCSQTKYVSEGHFLLKENTILFATEKKCEVIYKDGHDIIDSDELMDLVLPVPNKGTKLFFFNRIVHWFSSGTRTYFSQHL